ncbi:HTTM domain-containing protein [Sagittula sp. SSi028]|uniref:HTTM domain-containing protein n=1 Tax=Sagittula sp. SSi028 TaxID=3400636 RepID=UPI003AF9B2C9
MMAFDLALRCTQIGLALAVLQQAVEQMAIDRADRWWLSLRALACVLLLGQQDWAIWGLMASGVWALHCYDGPFNGGSDKMTLLITTCLCVTHAAPDPFWHEMALAYLAVQLVLSYVISGQVKLRNPAWRRGEALRDVFAFSAYPVSERLRALAHSRWVTFWGAWTVMLVETGFVLFMLHPVALVIGLALAAAFHLANAVLFGLNRFFWIWLAAYPSVIWLQGRLLG